MGALDDLFRKMGAQNSSAYSAYQQQLHQLNNQYYAQQNAFQNQLGTLGGLRGIRGAGLAYKPPKPLPPDPKVRIAEIDKELDIIRGIIPTPKGYKIDPRKAKALMVERAELEKNLT
jgi:hypothetical protein